MKVSVLKFIAIAQFFVFGLMLILTRTSPPIPDVCAITDAVEGFVFTVFMILYAISAVALFTAEDSAHLLG